jgi:biotin carboxylase
MGSSATINGNGLTHVDYIEIMPCHVYDKLTDEIYQAMRSEDMARGSSPKQYPHNSDKMRQEAIVNAAQGVHQAYGHRNAHLSECEACKADSRKQEQYDSRGHF